MAHTFPSIARKAEFEIVLLMNALPSVKSYSDTPVSGKIYMVGTLCYEKRQLIPLFGWLLWGDFAFTFFETIFARFMPLYLKELNASNTLIGVMTGSIAGMVNILFLPNISQWSDRFRSRIGRRIPFLLIVTPITAIALILIGLAPEIGSSIHRNFILHGFHSFSRESIILCFLSVCVVLFHFFNMVLVNSYNWLLKDVVPEELMARFLSWFRIVGTMGSFLFLWYVFPAISAHRREACLGVGMFYLTSFLFMCWRIKEGTYPEPDRHAKGDNLLGAFGRYFQDCLSVPLYRNFFIAYVLVTIATASAAPFLSLYAKHGLHLEMKGIGEIFAYSALVSALAYIPAGWLCERITSLRVTLCSLVLSVVGSLLAYFLVDGERSWLVYSVVMAVPQVAWGLGALALSMMLFPVQKFGQLSSGMNVFGCGGLIAGNFIIGKFMDFNHSDYRMVFIWSAFFFGLAIFPMQKVYQEWKARGGPNHYEPPVPW